MNEKWKIRAIRVWREWCKPILIVLVLFGSFRSAVADWNDVPTGSMKPTILEGDRIFVNKLAYGLRLPFTSWRIVEGPGPQRGDIAVMFSPESGDRLVKRIVGVPGDTVSLRGNRLLINGQPASYSRLDPDTIGQIEAADRTRHQFANETVGARTHAVMVTPRAPAPRSFDPIVLGEDQYFAMGDNRDNSKDSRWFGPVDRDQIVGRVSRVVLSLDRDNYYIPRWDRFFRAIP